MTTGLPEGWATIRVGDYFDSWGGMTPSTNEASYWGGNVPWVSSKDVKALRIAGGEEFITRKALQETRLRLCPVGSVLVVVRSGILAHTLPISVVESPVSINQDLKAFHSPDNNLNEWLALALRALSPEILSNNRKDGTTVQSIRYEELCNLFIPVPPTTEQGRITSRVTALSQKVEDTRDRLSRIPATLKRFRQAVLAAACSGKLTGNYRFDPFGTVPSRQREAHEFDLPDAWEHRKLSEVLSEPLANGRSVPDATVGFPVLRLTALRNGRVDLSERKIGSWTAHEASRFLVRRNDFLVSRGNGSLSLVGRGGWVDCQPDPVAYPDTLIRVRVLDSVNVRYLALLWNSSVMRNQIESLAHTTAGIHKVSQKDLEGLVLPIPPLSEQHEIVRRVEILFKWAESVQTKIGSASLRTDKLTQSILAKAFRGELVPTEAELARREGREYEPAAVLLERIRAERANHAQTSPSPKRRLRKSNAHV